VAEDFKIKSTAKIVWLGGKPSVDHFTKSKKRKFLGDDDTDFSTIRKKVSPFRRINKKENGVQCY
jgi:hypothetical protein